MMPGGKGLVFIFKEDHAKEFVDSILDKQGKEIIIVCANDEISRELSALGHACKTIVSYSHNTELQNAIGWIKSWPDRPILDGKSFKELMVYNGISIYWFLQTRFYLHRMRDLIILIERIKQVLDAEKPSMVWIKGGREIRHIISSLYGEERIAGFEQLHEDRSSKVSYKSYHGHSTSKLLLLKLMRGTFLPAAHKPRKNAKKKVVIATEVSNWRKDFDYTLQRHEVRDAFFHDISGKLLALGYDVTIVDFENRPGQLLKAYSTNKMRQASFGAPVRPWEKYIDFGTIMRSRSAGKRFAALWKRLQNSSGLAESLSYQNVPIYGLVKGDIEDLLKSLKAYAAVTFVEAAKRIVEIERPNIIVMHDEYGALQLALIKAAKDAGIPTVSLQHGIVSEEQISYVHDADHISGIRRDLLFPIPDKMCVWSESARRNLIEIAKFPPPVPVITGDPKIDFLPRAANFFNREKTRERLGIEKGKKIVMFATENLPSEEEKLLVAENVFKAAKSVPQCHMIIKMHPNETDTSFYDQTAKNSGLDSYTIIQDINLYELLQASDVVVLSYSTVAIEAMRMEKPVISLDLRGLHDNVPFIKDRKAIVIRDSKHLQESIQKCLEKTKEIQDVVTKGKAYAEQELGEADGKASERIVRLIQDLARDAEKQLPGAADGVGRR